MTRATPHTHDWEALLSFVWINSFTVRKTCCAFSSPFNCIHSVINILHTRIEPWKGMPIHVVGCLWMWGVCMFKMFFVRYCKFLPHDNVCQYWILILLLRSARASAEIRRNKSCVEKVTNYFRVPFHIKSSVDFAQLNTKCPILKSLQLKTRSSKDECSTGSNNHLGL